ncbi:MAG: hypothetical protein NT007_05735 [Candidatus Kapabacteria bacterium]|nr:hypothetical protein [Candidatus Kapabacteria bacterium]
MKRQLIYQIRYIAFFIGFICLSGGSCRNSYMYNPSLNLPPEPPTKGGDYRIFSSIGIYPEARPEQVTKSDNFGFGGGAMIAIVKAVSYNILFTTDNISFDFGTGLTIFLETQKKNMPAILNIRFQSAGDIWGSGQGLAIQCGTYLYREKNSSVYVMSGWGLAYSDDRKNNTITNGYGYGFLNNVGLSLEINKKASLLLETALIYQYSNYDKIERFLLAPNLCFMFRL